jgi:hypothetical protein
MEYGWTCRLSQYYILPATPSAKKKAARTGRLQQVNPGCVKQFRTAKSQGRKKERHEKPL